MKNRITILVSSCDKYSDLWDIFFTNLKKNWPDCPLNIILNTETKVYNFDGFNIICNQTGLGKDESYSWSDRLLDNLNTIKTKYTLFILDDYFIENKVDNSKVEQLLDDINKIKNFGALYLIATPIMLPTFYDKKINLYKLGYCASYKVSASVAIWDTKFLKSLTKRGLNPWQFEKKASIRAYFKNKRFYCLKDYFDGCRQDDFEKSNKHLDVLKIDYYKQLFQGKWTPECVEYIKTLNIDIDFNTRGIQELEGYKTLEARKEVYNWYAQRYNMNNEFKYNVKYLIKKIFKK